MTEFTRRGLFRRLAGGVVAAIVGPKVVKALPLENLVDPKLTLRQPAPVLPPRWPVDVSASYSYSCSISPSPSYSPSASPSHSYSYSPSAWFGDNGEME